MPPLQEPYLATYTQEDHRSPSKPFDPKAVTRASWEPTRKKKPKKNGPLLSFNRHRECVAFARSEQGHQTFALTLAQASVSYRNGNQRVMSARTKQWIVWIRWALLALRVLQLIAALGVLALMILITDVHPHASWLLRILSGVAALHCAYGIYHLSHPAGARTPSSSSAYHFFAAACDLCVLPIYAYGAVETQNHGAEWTTLLSDKSSINILSPAVYYAMIADSFVHAITLLVSVWLGIVFRKITLMPPDMNPLEPNLTARTRHKKAKSSTSTVQTDSAGGKRMSATNDSNHGSVYGLDNVPRGASVSFHHARAGSSISSRNRDSRDDLPSRHYQMAPTTPARNSTYSLTGNRDSMPLGRSSNRGSYVGLPLDDPGLDDTHAAESPRSNTQPRAGKFTENWTTSDSLIARTQQRNRALAAQERDRKSRSYEAIAQRYSSYGDSDSEDEANVDILAGSDFEDDPAERHSHPNPLRLNPATPPRKKTPYPTSVLSETSLNKRNVSGSADITDLSGSKPAPMGKVEALQQRYRNSSLQPDGDFDAKPYGDLRPATPPVMVGSSRQVSSGNDYDTTGGTFGRRNVSGKVAEEGQAGQSYGRFSIFRN